MSNIVSSDEKSTKILQEVRLVTRFILTPCEMLWSDWRQDWETELRRIHQSQPNARLSPGRLNDFPYLCWSISNTWDEVFAPLLSRFTLDALHQLRRLRNLAAHDDMVEDFHLELLDQSKTFLLKTFGELLEDLKPSLPEPVPVPEPAPKKKEPEIELKEGFQKLPVYILCDRSDSMIGIGITALNQGLESLHAAITSDPITKDKCLLSIIQFNQRAQVIFDLQDPSSVRTLPTINADGLTNFGFAFQTLRETLDRDVNKFNDLGESLLRPIVFMISDGAPNDERWRQDLESLIDPKLEISPVFSFYGVGNVPPNLVAEISTIIGMSRERVNLITAANDLGRDLESTFKKVVNSIIGSARSADGLFKVDLEPDENASI